MPAHTPDPNLDAQKQVLTQMMRLNAKIQGIVVGLVFGGAIMIATLWLVLKGGANVGLHLRLLDNFFFGYTVSFAGSLVGFAYGFVIGFAVGYFMAMVHNWLVDLRGYQKSRDAAGSGLSSETPHREGESTIQTTPTVGG